MNNLPSKLNVLNCSENLISRLDNLPISLLSLDCSDNRLVTLDNLPRGLKRLICNSNDLIHLNNLPDTLELLVCCYNDQLPSEDLTYWKSIKKFRLFYFTTKYSPLMMRFFLKFIRKRNCSLNEDYLHNVLYSPNYRFYKEFADEETLNFFQ